MARAGAGAEGRPWCFLVPETNLAAVHSKKPFPLTLPETLVGRTVKAGPGGLRLEEVLQVSSKHCTIIQAAGAADVCEKASPGTGDIIAYVKDSSSNGTFVASPSTGQEAERLEKGKPYGVRDGDIISFAARDLALDITIAFKFRVADENDHLSNGPNVKSARGMANPGAPSESAISSLAEIQRTNETLRKQLSDARAQLERKDKELSDAQRDHRAMEEAHQAKLDDAVRKAQAELEAVREECEARVSAVESQLAEAQQEAAKARKAAGAAEEERKEAEADAARFRTDRETAEERARDLEANLQAEREAHERFRREAAAASDKEKRTREELEEKVAKEKAKLEALRAEAEGAGQSAEEHRRQLDAERAARAAAERRADKAQRELDAAEGALLAERQKRAAAEDLAERRADVEKRAALDVAEAQEAARAASERHRVLVSAIGMICGPVNALFAAAEIGPSALPAGGDPASAGDPALHPPLAALPSASAGAGARPAGSGMPRPAASGLSFNPVETQAVPDASSNRMASSKRPFSALPSDGPAVSEGGAVSGGGGGGGSGRPSQRQRVQQQQQQQLDGDVADDAGTACAPHGTLQGTPLVRDGSSRNGPDSAREPPLSAVREEGAAAASAGRDGGFASPGAAALGAAAAAEMQPDGLCTQVSPATKAREAAEARRAKQLADQLCDPGETQAGSPGAAAGAAAAGAEAEEPPADAMEEEVEEEEAAKADAGAADAGVRHAEHAGSYSNQETLERPIGDDEDDDDDAGMEYGNDRDDF